MGSIEIRKLEESDAEAYREVRLEMLKDKPETFGESYKENITLVNIMMKFIW